MSIDLTTLTAAVFARLATATEGAAVRNALGAGASSVIPAANLSLTTLPARPLVALRGRPVSGESYEMRIAGWEWWVYDDAIRLYRRINSLLALIEAAYRDQTAIAGGRITIASVSGETTDAALNLSVRSLRLAFYTRG